MHYLRLHCNVVSTMTTTINNNTVSMNVQDTQPLVLRMLDPQELAEYNDMTPATLDCLTHFSDSVEDMAFQLDTGGAAGGIPHCI